MRLRVRRTANLHQGGTIHDVTAEVNPELCAVAVTAADAIGIPVTGIDLLVPDVAGTDYVFIEANERPGLANHEPQPTAEAFVDFLFPGSPACRRRGHPEAAAAVASYQVLVRNTISAASCAVDSCALRRPSRSTSRKSPYT